MKNLKCDKMKNTKCDNYENICPRLQLYTRRLKYT